MGLKLSTRWERYGSRWMNDSDRLAHLAHFLTAAFWPTAIIEKNFRRDNHRIESKENPTDVGGKSYDLQAFGHVLRKFYVQWGLVLGLNEDEDVFYTYTIIFTQSNHLIGKAIRSYGESASWSLDKHLLVSRVYCAGQNYSLVLRNLRLISLKDKSNLWRQILYINT